MHISFEELYIVFALIDTRDWDLFANNCEYMNSNELNSH